MILSTILVSGPVLFATNSVTADATDDKWTFLGALITAVIGPVVIYFISTRSLRPPSRNNNSESNNTISTGRGNTFSIEGMSSNMVEVLLSMWQKIDEMEETQEVWAAEREEFIRINEELRRHNRALAEGFDEVIDWIDRGALPPPPSVAQHVRDLVQRAIENGNYGSISSSE